MDCSTRTAELLSMSTPQPAELFYASFGSSSSTTTTTNTMARTAASSFHSTAPRTREERQAARHKELLEKGRLRARPGHGHVPANEPPLNPIMPDPCPALFEANAFQRDAASLFRQQKADKLCRQQVCVCSRCGSTALLRVVEGASGVSDGSTALLFLWCQRGSRSMTSVVAAAASSRNRQPS